MLPDEIVVDVAEPWLYPAIAVLLGLASSRWIYYYDMPEIFDVAVVAAVVDTADWRLPADSIGRQN